MNKLSRLPLVNNLRLRKLPPELLDLLRLSFFFRADLEDFGVDALQIRANLVSSVGSVRRCILRDWVDRRQSPVYIFAQPDQFRLLVFLRRQNAVVRDYIFDLAHSRADRLDLVGDIIDSV